MNRLTVPEFRVILFSTFSNRDFSSKKFGTFCRNFATNSQNFGTFYPNFCTFLSKKMGLVHRDVHFLRTPSPFWFVAAASFHAKRKFVGGLRWIFESHQTSSSYQMLFWGFSVPFGHGIVFRRFVRDSQPSPHPCVLICGGNNIVFIWSIANYNDLIPQNRNPPLKESQRRQKSSLEGPEMWTTNHALHGQCREPSGPQN